MTSDGIVFESVHEWEHLSLSEELFRKKYQDSLLNFRLEVQTMKDEYQSYLTFTEQISQTKVRNEENKVESNRSTVERITKDIANCKQEIAKVSAASARMKKWCEELNNKLICLEEEEKHLAEKKSAFALEVKETYNAFLKAKCCYKDNLRMYYTVDVNPDSPEITVNINFFTSKKSKGTENTVTLQINKKEHTARLLSMNPKLAIFDDLNNKLLETGDCAGLICCIRKCFLKMNTSSEKTHLF